VSATAPLSRAGPSDLSFLAAARYLPYFQQSRASVVLLKEEWAEAPSACTARVVVPNPHEALLGCIFALYPEAPWAPGVHASAVIGRGATWQDPVAIGPNVVLGDGVTLGQGVRIGAGCVLMDRTEIGDGTVLFPRVVTYPDTRVGARVILHAGVILGSDGFGFIPGKPGQPHRKIPHHGRAIIGDDVEIGANSAVDRGSIDDTVIGAGTKLDNLVHIAHNVRIGERCLIMAEAGIAGSVVVEDECIIGGQVGLSGHMTIGTGARISAGSMVWGDLEPGKSYTGHPAREHRELLRSTAALRRLADLADQLEDLVRRREPDA
jgi:UDP-3-O-[3-hydroxymyristoyl] glucosamine N-acyltransferase